MSLRPHRIPLGLLMLARGDIDATQLREALEAQRRCGGGRIGEWIEHLGYAGEAQVTAGIAAQWACPVLPRIPAQPSEVWLPLPLLRSIRMVPVHYTEALRTLCIAFSEAVDYAALLAIEQAIELRAEPCIVSSRTLDSLLARMEVSPRRVDHVFATSQTPREMTRITSSYAEALTAESVRLVRCAEFVWARVRARNDAVNLLFPAEEPRQSFRP